LRDWIRAAAKSLLKARQPAGFYCVQPLAAVSMAVA